MTPLGKAILEDAKRNQGRPLLLVERIRAGYPFSAEELQDVESLRLNVGKPKDTPGVVAKREHLAKMENAIRAAKIGRGVRATDKAIEKVLLSFRDGPHGLIVTEELAFSIMRGGRPDVSRLARKFRENGFN